MTHLTTPDEFFEARADLTVWLEEERTKYSDVKYKIGGPEFEKLVLDMQTFGLVGGEWEVFLTNYWRRAQLMELSTPAGRQAFGKFIVTCMAAMEHAICVYGPLPRPGEPSGEIHAD